jgi:adenosylcobinamide-GDP ribazoletransferase
MWEDLETHLKDWARDSRDSIQLALGLKTRASLEGEVAPYRAFPAAGAGVGLIGGIVLLVAVQIGFPLAIAAATGILVIVAAGAAQNEDVLMRVARGAAAAEKSPDVVNAFGVTLLLMALLVRTSALVAIGDAATIVGALVAAGALSYFVWVLVSYFAGPADDDSPTERGLLESLLLAAIIIFICVPPLAATIILLAGFLIGGLGAFLSNRVENGEKSTAGAICQQSADILTLSILAGFFAV